MLIKNQYRFSLFSDCNIGQLFINTEIKNIVRKLASDNYNVILNEELKWKVYIAGRSSPVKCFASADER